MDSNGDLVLFDEFADIQIVTLPELEDGIKYGEPYGGVLGAIAILKVILNNYLVILLDIMKLIQ